MPVNRSGSYFSNPAVGRAHEAPDAPMGIPEHGEAPKDYQAIQVEKKPEGGYRSTAHPTDGSEPDIDEHATLHEAHQAMNDKFGEDGCAGDDDTAEFDENEPSQGEESLPAGKTKQY